MSVIITSAYPSKICKIAGDLLESLGVAVATPSASHGYTPGEITRKMCAAHHIAEQRRTAFLQVQPGTTWQVLGADLFLANADGGSWGWAAKHNIFFLDFWRSFDPQCRFLLLYTSPERGIAHCLHDGNINSVNVQQEAEAWRAYHVEMLRFYHRHADISLLADLSAAEAQPDKFRTQIEQRLDVHETRDLRGPSEPSLGSALTELIIGTYREALASAKLVHDELQSTADLPSIVDEENQNLIAAHAWREYVELQTIPPAVDDCEKSTVLGEALDNANETISILRAQLVQTQEELEHYFVKSQANALASAASDDAQDLSFVSTMDKVAASEVDIDMTGFISGSNWYHAEKDGRWAGPGTISTLQLPSLQKGRYRLEASIVDAMSDDLINNVQIHCGDQKILLKKVIRSDLGGALAPLKRARSSIRRHRPYPVRISGEFDVPDNLSPSQSLLAIEFPRTLSPASLGQNDERNLSARFKSIRLIPV